MRLQTVNDQNLKLREMDQINKYKNRKRLRNEWLKVEKHRNSLFEKSGTWFIESPLLNRLIKKNVLWEIKLKK